MKRLAKGWMLAAAAVALLASAGACGGSAIYVTDDYVQMQQAQPEPLPQPIARTNILLWALDDRVLPPPPTEEGLADVRKAIKKGKHQMQMVVSSQSVAGAAAISAGAALIERDMNTVFGSSVRALNAVAKDGPPHQLVVFLRRQTNQSIKPSVTTIAADAYLLLEDGTILHSHEQMNEQIYVGKRNIPASPPGGMTTVTPDNRTELMLGEGLQRPNYYHSVVARHAIADVAAQLSDLGG